MGRKKIAHEEDKNTARIFVWVTPQLKEEFKKWTKEKNLCMSKLLRKDIIKIMEAHK